LVIKFAIKDLSLFEIQGIEGTLQHRSINGYLIRLSGYISITKFHAVTGVVNNIIQL
jgi:hypothetical protein